MFANSTQALEMRYTLPHPESCSVGLVRRVCDQNHDTITQGQNPYKNWAAYEHEEYLQRNHQLAVYDLLRLLRGSWQYMVDRHPEVPHLMHNVLTRQGLDHLAQATEVCDYHSSREHDLKVRALMRWLADVRTSIEELMSAVEQSDLTELTELMTPEYANLAVWANQSRSLDWQSYAGETGLPIVCESVPDLPSDIAPTQDCFLAEKRFMEAVDNENMHRKVYIREQLVGVLKLAQSHLEESSMLAAATVIRPNNTAALVAGCIYAPSQTLLQAAQIEHKVVVRAEDLHVAPLRQLYPRSIDGRGSLSDRLKKL